MDKKQLKPSFYRLTATCTVHGMVTVERKPNPKAGQRHPNETGGLIQPHPSAVVCPHCVFHCKVTGAELIEE
jgi:hypothetical protein